MLESAIKHNLDAQVYFAEYFSIITENGIQKLFYKDKKIESYPDLAYFRTYDFDLMENFESKGIYIVNSLQGYKNSLDKYTTRKIANSLKISGPTSIVTKNYNYDVLKKFLGETFVMKERSGSLGTGVFLIESQKDLDNNLCLEKNYLFEQYIEKSKGKDIRLYFINDYFVAAIERSSTNNDFRSNVHLGASTRVVDVSEELVEQSKKLAKEMGLTICSVDYLFDGENYYLCEVNANASFSAYIKAGFNMQDLIMKYISTINYTNYWARLKDIQKANMDFAFENKNSKIIISAPHAISQTREGQLKPKDMGSGELALKVATENDLTYIIKAKNNGNSQLGDDANYYDCQYKEQLVKVVKNDDILFDIHSLKTSRPEELLICTNNMQNILYDTELLNFVINCFKKHDINVCVDTLYFAKEKTVCGYINKKCNIKAFQFEFNSKLINPILKSNKINQISSAFNEIINYINN